jgi:hypothetical protein
MPLKCLWEDDWLEKVVWLGADITLVSSLVTFFVGTCDSFQFNFLIPDRSYQDINEEIIWASILMASLIALLITLALCYIAYEKCHKKRELYINV